MSNFRRCMPMRAVGQVIKERVWGDQRVVKVRAQNMSLDPRLLMYFPKKKDRWCMDFKKETKMGDIVVIKNLDQRMERDIFSQVDYIMYQVGNTVDPVTGQKCRGTEFIDEAARVVEQQKRQVEDMKQTRTVVK